MTSNAATSDSADCAEDGPSGMHRPSVAVLTASEAALDVATPEIAALVGLFEQVAAGEGWQPGDQLRAYRDHSVYFALRVGGKLAGGLQLVLPDATGRLPCQRVWPEPDINREGNATASHVAVLALRREFRGHDQGGLFWHLAIALWRHCVLSGIRTLYLEVTPRVLPLYRRLGWPLQVCGPERLHWGEPCLLCSLDVCQVAGALAERAVRSARYRHILARAVAKTPTG